VAITRPKPRDEPVTQTTCPAKGLSEFILYSLANYGGAARHRSPSLRAAGSGAVFPKQHVAAIAEPVRQRDDGRPDCL
jgi:hypothetical protein